MWEKSYKRNTQWAMKTYPGDSEMLQRSLVALVGREENSTTMHMPMRTAGTLGTTVRLRGPLA
jgi:hypothetical protein